MIAKRVMRDSGGRSDFSKLAKYMLTALGKSDPATWARTADYILDTAHQGAKVGTIRITNCVSTDPAMAVAEITATQVRNTRSKTDKTYHLVISFPPGERPDEKQLTYIEDELCASIGFREHQRLSAIHLDTDHLHVHVAINKVHPKRFANIEPYFDYRRLMETCTRLEIELNLERTHERGAPEPVLDVTQEISHAITRENEFRALDPRAAAALRESYLEEIAREPQAPSLDGVRTLSGVGVVYLDGGGQVLLPGDASHHVEPPGAQCHDGVRRGGDGAGRSGARSGEAVEAHTPRKPRRMEAFASRQSLLRFAQEGIREGALAAGSWEAFHDVLATHGLVALPRGAGLVVGTPEGIFIKASDIDRELSFGKLIQKLGAYPPVREDAARPAASVRYQDRPNQGGPQTDALFAAYSQAREHAVGARGAARQRLRDAHRRYAENYWGWYTAERLRIRNDPRLRGRVKYHALKALGARKKTDERHRRALEQEQWAQVRAAAPLPTWQGFLEARAAAGDLEALNLLRRRPSSERRRENGVRPEAADAAQPQVKTELKPQVRHNGDVVYRMADGGTVVDSTVALRIETASGEAMTLALSLAAERFNGQRLHIDGSAEFGEKLAQVARTREVPVQFADPVLEAARQYQPEAAVNPVERSSDLESYLEDRNHLRSRVSDLDFHRPWSPTDVGTYRYAGRRHLGEGSTIVLLQGTQVMLVMPVTAPRAAQASGWSIGTPIEVAADGSLSVQQARSRRR